MVTGQRCKPPNVSVPELEYAGLEAYSVIASASICRPALNSLSCDADSATTAGDCFTADDAEAVISPPPNWTAIQASNMVSHLCIGHKDNKKIRTMKLFFALRFELSHKSPNATQKRRIGSSPHALSACAKPPPPLPPAQNRCPPRLPVRNSYRIRRSHPASLKPAERSFFPIYRPRRSASTDRRHDELGSSADRLSIRSEREGTFSGQSGPLSMSNPHFHWKGYSLAELS